MIARSFDSCVDRGSRGLIAQAVRSCAERGIRHFCYGQFTYGSKRPDGLAQFKTHNGFRQFDLLRYYVPLNVRGRIAMALGAHHAVAQHMKPLDYVIPGGSMVATAQDVSIFLRALNDGSLLNDEEQAIYSSIYVYEHTGLLPGYQSIARYQKDMDTVVIQFTNTSGGNSWMKSEAIYSRIVRILRKQH